MCSSDLVQRGRRRHQRLARREDRLVDLHLEPPLRRTVHGAEVEVHREEPVLHLHAGDHDLLRDGVAGFVDSFRNGDADAMILLQHVPNPSEYGVAELNDDGTVRRLVEKPKEPQSDLALVGVYLFTQAIFDAARALEPSWRGELEITDAIQGMVDAGLRVEPHVVTGWWKDTGQLADMLEANRLKIGRAHV